MRVDHHTTADHEHRREVNRMAKSVFDGDPDYRRLKKLRETYDGPVGQDGNPVTGGSDHEALMALRETGVTTRR
jgi:hypothetical protein